MKTTRIRLRNGNMRIFTWSDKDPLSVKIENGFVQVKTRMGKYWRLIAAFNTDEVAEINSDRK